ncbi:MAG: glycosyltransferase family 9 protein [Planctomycetes bacterium]|nr:glycosyltransferase family 9 protein [Planctomycetota bacterium]
MVINNLDEDISDRYGSITRTSGVMLPRTFLIVSLRYIGDVLLSTPLSRSIKVACPEAVIDYLVFEGAETILAGNPDIRSILTIKPDSRNKRDFLFRFRQYDIAIGVNASDRTTFQLIAKGKKTIGFANPRCKEWWKKLVLSHYSIYDPNRHVVELLLSQLRYIGIPPISEVSLYYQKEDLDAAREAAGQGDFILLHPYTRWEYKKWPSRNWADLSRRIKEEMKIRTMFTMAPGAFERRIQEEIQREGISKDHFINRILSLPQMAALLSMTMIYIGVDTVVTHMAAALGRPIMAIFGPTPPWRWGPWPNGHPVITPYEHKRGVQRKGNIIIMQKDWKCVACDRMGCEHTRDSKSQCLVDLSVGEVYTELRRLMNSMVM